MFFVLEGKGFKLRILGANVQQKLDQVHRKPSLSDSVLNALSCLKTAFKCFHWEFMQDRRKGELYLDIAFTYFPQKMPYEPVVGFWCLSFLQKSFSLAGFTCGTIHPLSLLNAYGAQQAEMRVNHSEVTHIINRLAYNQIWEVARPSDNKRNLANPAEAYSCTSNFVEHMRKVIHLYSNGPQQNQTYGVRDEFRIGYTALKQIVKTADKMVSRAILLYKIDI
jgi:hypothetical protein